MTERAIFEAAIEITDTVKRTAFLNEACGGDAALRERLDALLASHDKASQFLNVPAVNPFQAPGDDSDRQTTMMPKSGVPKSREQDDGDSERNAGPDLSFLLPSSKPGSIGLLGHYEILQILGRGAFGAVFKAFDEKLHRMVAIKVLNPALAATSPPRKRFLREARSSAAVRHENIVAIHAVEEQPVPYLVMEYIPGKTLQQWLDEHGPLDPVDVLKFGQQIATGLAAAHAQGLIHRDIKPANILLDTSIEARIKITDFGLARAVDDASMTQSGLIAGTPMYMAPEQARGQTLDHRADLFSLGTVLYTMASGRPPFRASNTIAVLKRVCEDTPRPVSEVIPGSPKWLDEIIAKLHAKEPDDRFQSAREVSDLLARYLIQPPQSSPHAPREESRMLPDADRANDIAQPTTSTVRSAHFTRSVKATIAVLVAVVLIAAFVFNRNATRNKNLASRATSAPGQAESNDSTNPDRRAAEWVRSIGGYIRIKENGQERSITAVEDLPRGAFELTFADLHHNPKVSDEGLANFKDCKNLTALELHNTQASDAGLVNFKDCKKLTALNLANVPVSDVGLANFNDCKNLTILDLLSTKVSDQGLANFKDCKNLTILSLYGTQVSNAGLANFSGCKSLTSLTLGSTMLSDSGLVYFQDCVNLQTLNLYGAKVSDAGLAHFKDCKNFADLNLSDTKVSDAGLADLAGYPMLRWLGVKQTKVTEAGVKKLSAALPGCKIEWDGGVIEPRTGWHGWPSDAPPPAIAPFNAEQAKQHQEAWAKYLGVRVEYTNSIGMKFRLIPPGEFSMGSTPAEIEEALKFVGENKHWLDCIKSEAPQHKVILTLPVYLGVHEVTQAEYEKVMGQNPSHFAPLGAGKEAVAGIDTTSHPVETIDWNDAAEFCAKLSQKETFKPFYFRKGDTTRASMDGNGYQLPTEAEWEFACRAGTTTRFWIDEKDEDLLRAGWFDANSGGRTHAAGELNRNPFGLFDMNGNVWEWMQDWWGPTYYKQFHGVSALDPRGPSPTDFNRVIRGGHCNDPASFFRSSFRVPYSPKTRGHNLGIRVSLTVDAVRQALNVDGPKIVKSGVPVGTNRNQVAEQGRSAWDDLDPAQIPEAERVPRQPEGLVAVLGQHRRRVWSTPLSSSVSSDGTQFTLTTDDGLYLFGRDPKQPARFFNLGVRHSSATFLPDGRIAAFVTDGDVQKTQLLIFAKPHDGMPLEKQAATNTNNNELIHHATASSDGQWLAAFDQSEGIVLWRLGDAPPQRAAKLALPKLDLGILPCGFSPDAHWFCFMDSSQGQSVVHLIDLRGDTPREATVLKADADEKSDAPAKGFKHAAFLSDGRLATADRNGRTWFWKVNDGEPQRVGSIRDSGQIVAAAQSLRLTIFEGVQFRVWDLATDPPRMLGTSATTFQGDNIATLSITPNGETIFNGHLNGSVHFWNVSQNGVTELDPLVPNPNSRYWHRYWQFKVVDRFLCASLESSRVGIWQPTRDGLQTLAGVPPSFLVLGASDAKRQLIVLEPDTGGGTALLRCDADRVTQTRRITGNSHSAALNDEGRRLAIGRNNGTDEVLELWGWESDDLPAKKLSEIKLSPDPVVQPAFAEAGRMLVGRLGHFRIQIWDVKDNQLVPRTTLPLLPYGFLQFAVAPDGKTLATVGGNTLALWNLTSDLTQPSTTFTIPTTTAVAFSPDGRRLAASFWENGASAGVQIINLATGVVEKRLTFPGRVHELTFTDDGRHLITGNANATIYVVRLQGPPTK